MPTIKWHRVTSSPFMTLKLIANALYRSVLGILNVLIHPSRGLSIRTELVRIWVGTSFDYNADIWYSAPQDHDVQSIDTDGTLTYVIPTTRPEDIKNADAVLVYGHGGGLSMGHPLQNLEEYERWVALAESKGKKLVILAPVYPLSTTHKWPAQRNAVAALYNWALSQSIPSSKIVFGGDSAGCNLLLLYLLHLRDATPSTPLPAAAVLYSPAIDLTGSMTLSTPRISTDFLFTFNDIIPVVNELVRPAHLPFDTPEISALLAKDVSGLPPQLVCYSQTEIFASDAERWVARSSEAGVKIVEHKPIGMLHTYSLGWPFVARGSSMMKECDELLLGFIFGHVK